MTFESCSCKDRHRIPMSEGHSKVKKASIDKAVRQYEAYMEAENMTMAVERNARNTRPGAGFFDNFDVPHISSKRNSNMGRSTVLLNSLICSRQCGHVAFPSLSVMRLCIGISVERPPLLETAFTAQTWKLTSVLISLLRNKKGK